MNAALDAAPRRWRAALQPRDAEDRTFRIWVGVAMALGLSVRTAFVLIKQTGLFPNPGDVYWYHMQAKLVADGRGFLDPVAYFRSGEIAAGAQHPPGFVVALALLDLIGISSPQGQRLVMSLVGTVTILVIAILARRVASVRVGIVAAFLAAVYPNIWINDGMLMPETLYVLTIAVSLLAVYRYLERPNLADLAVLSVALTAAATTRPESLVLFGVMVTPLVLTRTRLPWSQRIGQLAVAAIIPIVTLAPWVLHNLTRFETPVTLSTGAGQTLAAGNCEYTYFGPKAGYYDLRCVQEPVVTGIEGDPSERDLQFREVALQYMSEQRSELPRVVAARIGRVWHLYQPIQSVTLDGWIEGRAGGPPSDDQRVAAAALIGYAILMPLAIGGGVLLWRRGERIWPLLVQPALVTVVAATTFGVTRYRAGAEITLVVLAAVAIVAIHQRVTRTEEATTTPEPLPEGVGVDAE
jgi:4-amino-4-deoxy-L-arabinose transferase-like glycosyltransferase